MILFRVTQAETTESDPTPRSCPEGFPTTPEGSGCHPQEIPGSTRGPRGLKSARAKQPAPPAPARGHAPLSPPRLGTAVGRSLHPLSIASGPDRTNGLSPHQQGKNQVTPAFQGPGRATTGMADGVMGVPHETGPEPRDSLPRHGALAVLGEEPRQAGGKALVAGELTDEQEGSHSPGHEVCGRSCSDSWLQAAAEPAQMRLAAEDVAGSPSSKFRAGLPWTAGLGTWRLAVSGQQTPAAAGSGLPHLPQRSSGTLRMQAAP